MGRWMDGLTDRKLRIMDRWMDRQADRITDRQRW